MTSEGTPAPSDTPRDPLADALAELRDDYGAKPNEPADRYWLRVGLALGLRRPGRAQLLLERLEGNEAEAVAPSGAVGTLPDEPTAAAESDGPGESDADPAEVPVQSLLLARAAALPLTEPAETAFGWASRLAAGDITRMGRVVADLVDGGGPHDLTRGFGLAWTGGVKLPNSELNGLFGRFTDLELTIASVLAGHDLRGIAARSKPGVSAIVQGWFRQSSSPGASEAAAVLDRLGEPAQRGLIAVWNTWAAVRYRASIPAPVYEQLVEPWTRVVGRLPEP